MSEWNEPRPNQIGGFSPRERSYKIFKTKSGNKQITTDRMIGFFHQSDRPLNLEKISNSKIISIPHAPKSCSKCGGYMQLRTNGEGYTCQNRRCTDSRNQKRMAKIDLKRRSLGKTPIMPRCSVSELEAILKA